MSLEIGTLVLSRRRGEGLLIGTDIFIQVLQINGNQVKISIRAPKAINIVRDELIKNRSSKEVIG